MPIDPGLTLGPASGLRAVALCQCERWGNYESASDRPDGLRCRRPATQEDMRCDTCRAGCWSTGLMICGETPGVVASKTQTFHDAPPAPELIDLLNGGGEVA